MFSLFQKIYHHKKASKIGLLSLLLIAFIQPVWAAGPPGPSIFSNSLAMTLMLLMVVLLIIIGVLANVLISTGDWKVKKRKKENALAAALVLLIFLFISPVISAQDTKAVQKAGPVAQSIGGLSSATFYLMIVAIFLELFVILVLLINVRLLLKKETAKLVVESTLAKVSKPTINWWSRINKFKPVAQEADIDLGHDYDGIRELDNRLPPWWIYGFYVSIIFAAIYLWRFHVSHTAPSSKEEYEQSVQMAELKIQEHLKLKGDAVDENTVTFLTGADDINAGKKIFVSSCAACHKETGGGDVGPNLTDEYWMHGGNIKSIFKTVKYGVNAMPQWQNAYSNTQVAQIASYVKSLKGTNPPNAKGPQGELFKEAVTTGKSPADSVVVKENKVAMN